MRWTDELRVETPEQVQIDLELAGLGSRFLAQLIDWVWKAGVSLALVLLAALTAALLGRPGLAEAPSTLVQAVVVGLLYLLWLGSAVYFEVRWNGQTPGKRAAGVRVVRDGGGPIDFRAAAVRNLLAVADFLPAFHLLGAVLVLLTPRRQRLGDLAAGTVVVRERAVDLGADPGEELAAAASPDVAFTAAHLAALTPADRAVLREFLRRFPTMDPEGGRRLAVRMANGFRTRTGYPLAAEITGGAEARAFLASLYRDLEAARRHD